MADRRAAATGVLHCGTYVYLVDEKGRVVIPQEYRQRMGSPLVLVRGLEGRILVVPQAAWERQCYVHRQDAAWQDYYGSAVVVATPHTHTQRVQLSVALRRHAGIGLRDQVALIWRGGWVEIVQWERWQAHILGLERGLPPGEAEGVLP